VSARYVVRFDDICPTMNWRVWARLEPILNRYGVRPVMSVVPDNQDPSLVIGQERGDFWARVRDWQVAGWTIALHGHQHLYCTQNAGLVGINSYSEFAGLPAQVQRTKLRQGLEIFAREGVRADAWVAPAHSFDEVTVRLLLEAGVSVISDGFHLRPVMRLGATWIPQQLWRLRSLPCGTWTVCYHHNQFDEAAINRFERDIAAYAARIVDFRQLTSSAVVEWGFLDRAFSWLWRIALKLKHARAPA
jgi:predicted deacetylase